MYELEILKVKGLVLGVVLILKIGQNMGGCVPIEIFCYIFIHYFSFDYHLDTGKWGLGVTWVNEINFSVKYLTHKALNNKYPGPQNDLKTLRIQ